MNILWTIFMVALCESFPVNNGPDQCSLYQETINCTARSLKEVPKFTNSKRFLDGNQISNMTVGVFDSFIGLTYLDLGGNMLTSLPFGLFDALTELQQLKLTGNMLTSLSVGLFDTLTRLIILRLSRNKISTLSVGLFDALKKLKVIEIHENQITGLTSGIFDSLTRLITLYISYNQITELTVGIFDALTNLDYIEITDNQITGLTVGIFDALTKLDTLGIERNRIASLPVGLFNNLKLLEEFIKKNLGFNRTRRVLEAKRKSLKSISKGHRPNIAYSLASGVVATLWEKGIIGTRYHHHDKDQSVEDIEIVIFSSLYTNQLYLQMFFLITIFLS